jgi:hypothetical protein
MNNQPKSIWKKPWKGPRGVLFWLLIVTAAAFLFATAMMAAGVFFSPALIFVWADGFGVFVWRIPGLVPVLIGLELAVVFVMSVAAAFILYVIVRRIVCRAMPRLPDTITNQEIKIPS